jgi:hypothetical protein
VRAKRYALLALVLVSAARVEAQEGAALPQPPVAPAPDSTPQAAQGPGPSASEVTSAPDDAANAPPANEPAPASDATSAVEVVASEPLPAPEGAAPSEELAQLTEAELAALGLNAEQAALDTSLRFSGFMDVNYLQLLNPNKAPYSVGATGDEASLFVGHLNLYLNKNITESFRMMAEVRFMYAPNGSAEDFTSSQPSYTQVRDYNGNGAYVRWGGISVERAYGEWSPFAFLNLRLGAFLTPYGIWNVDHGSPVFVPVMRPYAVNGAFFPEHQTGLEVFGRWGMTSNLAVRYHLTLSNGLGPVSEYRDLDRNKAIGGRLAFEYTRLGTLQIGGSSFYGKDTSGYRTLGLGSSGGQPVVVNNKVTTSQSMVTAVAADVLWKYRGLQVQGEWVGQRVAYTDAGRTLSLAAGKIGVPQDAVMADAFNWAGYGLLGYRLPWWGIMPFGTLEYQHSSVLGVVTQTSFSQVGLNIRPADAIVLKVEYQFAFAGTESTQIKTVATQLAWAF